jgi:hypothetical protein
LRNTYNSGVPGSTSTFREAPFTFSVICDMASYEDSPSYSAHDSIACRINDPGMGSFNSNLNSIGIGNIRQL